MRTDPFSKVGALMAFSIFSGFFKKNHSVKKASELAILDEVFEKIDANIGTKRAGEVRPFFIILLEGEMMDIVHQLLKDFPSFGPESDNSCMLIQKNSKGGVIVTSNDPDEVISRYKTSSVKFVIANDGKPYDNIQNRFTASRILSDLIISNDYNRMCFENGMPGGKL